MTHNFSSSTDGNDNLARIALLDYQKAFDHNGHHLPAFRFSNIPVEKVALTLKNLKVSKSTGLDKIPAKVLKIASSIIASSLTSIFNLSLSSGIFIDDWKNAHVCPVYKGNDRRDMGNYRPISILPIIRKTFFNNFITI